MKSGTINERTNGIIRRRFRSAHFFELILTAVLAISQGPARGGIFGGLSNQVFTLEQDWLEAQRNYQDEIQKHRGQGQPAPALENPDKIFAARFLKLGEKGTNSEAGAEALVYAIDADANGQIADRAAELLGRYHVNDKPLELLFDSSPRPSKPASESLFRAIAEKSDKAAFRGQAKILLADMLKEDSPAEAESLYNEVLAKYANVKSHTNPSEKLGDEARHGLFYVQHLLVGKMAPDFEGEDVAGKKVRLSDFTNKVVVVCFCSEFCAPCRKLYPYWHSLVQRMSGQPFGFLMVVPDSKAQILKSSKREDFIWPVICDSNRAEDSINTRWYVQGWPNIFLMDATGVIRQHWVGSPGQDVLDREVQKYVALAQRR